MTTIQKIASKHPFLSFLVAVMYITIIAFILCDECLPADRENRELPDRALFGLLVGAMIAGGGIVLQVCWYLIVRSGAFSHNYRDDERRPFRIMDPLTRGLQRRAGAERERHATAAAFGLASPETDGDMRVMPMQSLVTAVA